MRWITRSWVYLSYQGVPYGDASPCPSARGQDAGLYTCELLQQLGAGNAGMVGVELLRQLSQRVPSVARFRKIDRQALTLPSHHISTSRFQPTR